MCVLLITRLLRLRALVNRFNHTSGVTVVTPTDLPKSVRNRCVIKVFGGVFMLSRCFLNFSLGVGAFVTELSQTSSFFSCNSPNHTQIFDTITAVSNGFESLSLEQTSDSFPSFTVCSRSSSLGSPKATSSPRKQKREPAKTCQRPTNESTTEHAQTVLD